MISFLRNLAATVGELNRLLGTRLVPGHPGDASPIGRSFRAVLALHNRGDYRHRDYELLRLQFLALHLQRIEQARPELLRHYKRRLMRAGSTDSFFGVRFEVNIASSLLRKGVAFDASERPDFTISAPPVGLECTSARLRTAHSKTDLTYKVRSAVHQKKSRGYATPSTALFIDITNLAHISSSFDPAPFRVAAATALAQSPFGAILMFTYLVYPLSGTLSRIESNYIRVDHPGISPKLTQFLDEHFPITGHLVQDHSIPYEG